jgi:predicted nucleic acid-binding protein
MRVVLCDTSPVRYLVLIGESAVLHALYGRVLIPESVADELNQPHTPDIVRQWISQPPTWLEIVATPHNADPLMLTFLDRGERDAILVALELKADLLLMDDREGVEEAVRLGLVVTGTLGVLDRAAEKGLVDLADTFRRLRTTNFRVSPALLDRILADNVQRKRKGP